MIQAILLTNNQIIISQSTPEADPDTGEIYFSLRYPYLFSTEMTNRIGYHLTPWLSEVTDPTEKFIVYPDKIITIRSPKPEIVTFYKKLVLMDEDQVVNEDESVETGEDEVFEEEDAA